jgi:hypothetical protein
MNQRHRRTEKKKPSHYHKHNNRIYESHSQLLNLCNLWTCKETETGRIRINITKNDASRYYDELEFELQGVQGKLGLKMLKNWKKQSRV